MEKNHIWPRPININRMWLNSVVIFLSIFSVIIYYNVSKAKDTPIKPQIKIQERPVPKFPHCPKNDEHSLILLINKFVKDGNVCNTTIPVIANYPSIIANGAAENCHQVKVIPASTQKYSHPTTSKETRDTVIVYVAISLLLTSLGAALIEVWKVYVNNKKAQGRNTVNTTAKASPSAAPGLPGLPGLSGLNGAMGIPTKPELTRRCSLADLTVLRHHRRESMMRRDSAMHMSIDNGSTVPGSGNCHRVPLKTMGTLSIRPKLRVD